MNRQVNEKKWLDEFNEFVNSEGALVPEALSKKILNRIHGLLNPSGWVVFAKLFAIHAVVGTLSLAVCNQFGLNPFNTSFSLSDYVMKFGESACMTFCGFIFIGLSVSLATLILSREEFMVLKRNSPIQIFSLGLFSLALFVAAGAKIFFAIAVMWLIGAMIGGVLPILVYNSRLRLSRLNEA